MRALSRFAVVIPVALALRADAQPLFTGIGLLSGPNPLSAGLSISADGQVVAGVSWGAGAYPQPIHWSSASGLVPISAGSGGLYATNSDGSVSVGVSGVAHRWTASGGWQSLGALPGHKESVAFGVSGDGSVVVGRSGGTPSTGGDTHAFRWTESGGMQSLGQLPFPGSFDSTAGGVSDDGNIIVGSTFQVPGIPQPFVWTPQSGMQLLDNGKGAALAINGNGSVIAGNVGFGGGLQQACLWTAAGRIDLGIASGHDQSSAGDLSDDGKVVVGIGLINSVGTRASFWTAETGMVDLKEHLLSLGTSGLDNWTLVSATGISGDGTTICGFGTNPMGFTEGWVAHIPSPCAAALLALAALPLAGRRR